MLPHAAHCLARVARQNMAHAVDKRHRDLDPDTHELKFCKSKANPPRSAEVDLSLSETLEEVVVGTSKTLTQLGLGPPPKGR